MFDIGRRSTFRLLAGSALATLACPDLASAAGQSVTVGIDLSLTGADAETANLIRDGFMLAIDEANAKGGPAGIHVDVLMLDDGTATAGQYDPAQGATNARKMVADRNCVAALGPMSSTPGKAMAAIFSQGDLATITPTSTNPDITDPKFAGLYRPAGKAIYFRTVTTDAYQGPSLANYFADVLKVKTMFGLDDSGAYGVGLAAAFEAQARKKGIAVLGHDRLDPKAPDYTAALTKIKSLGPQLLYYGGDAQAGVKLVKQSYDIIPNVMKAGGDGMYGPSILQGAGFPAVNGWYATVASPHMMEDARLVPFVQRFVARTGHQPSDYSITAYDAALIVLDAIGRVANTGKTVTRSAVRDAIQTTRLETLQGMVSFDPNGDLISRVVSIFQIRHDGDFPPDNILHQYKYIGAAPQDAA
ncbi:branched-chain amino acid ABC transporter substrate-binding protein [Rhodopila sp.]|uniref:branched-chain amino acid ABC transporter substrate-binding protein n=1 Tax=Rhodopila sp. TaxID=2480087 RepID=UPI003D09B617